MLETAYECEGLSTCCLAIRKYNGVVAFHRGTYVTFCDSVVYQLVFRPCEDLIKLEFRRRDMSQASCAVVGRILENKLE
jgi:hypothetical protein